MPGIQDLKARRDAVSARLSKREDGATPASHKLIEHRAEYQRLTGEINALENRTSLPPGLDRRAPKATYADTETCGECGSTGEYGAYCGGCGGSMAPSYSPGAGDFCTSCGGAMSGERSAHVCDQHAVNLRTAEALRAQAPLSHSEILTAELATARTRPERRSAVQRFEASQRTPEEARFTDWLRRPEHSRAYEDRAAGEATGSAGGYFIRPGFSGDLIHYMREFDRILAALELWESADGETTVRPAYSQFSTAATDTENTAFAEGPYATFAQQNFGLSPTFASSYRASFQLVQDAGVNLDKLVASALGESLGRVLAPVAQSALYAGINAVGATSGANGGFLTLSAATAVTFSTGASTELIQNTINLDTAAQMIAALDSSYLESASWYFSPIQWAGLLRQVDSSKHTQIDSAAATRRLYNIPVTLTSQTLAASASTVSGPILGDLAAAATLRVVDNSLMLLRSHEKYADWLQMYYRSALRADVAIRDSRAVVGVKYAAS